MFAPLGVEHVVERVEERPQVRVDLREHVAGKEPEPLARLDRGPGEDDPRHLPLVQRRDRERHRQVGLARAGRADPERDRAAADRVDVCLLRHGLRRDLLAPVAPDDVLEHLANVLVALERAEHGVDRLRADLVAALDQLDELVDHRARLGDVVVVALQRQLVAAEPDRAVEPVAQGLEHPVPEPRQLGRDGVREIENFLHAHQCRSHTFGTHPAQTRHTFSSSVSTRGARAPFGGFGRRWRRVPRRTAGLVAGLRGWSEDGAR